MSGASDMTPEDMDRLLGLGAAEPPTPRLDEQTVRRIVASHGSAALNAAISTDDPERVAFERLVALARPDDPASIPYAAAKTGPAQIERESPSNRWKGRGPKYGEPIVPARSWRHRTWVSYTPTGAFIAAARTERGLRRKTNRRWPT